MSTTNAAVDALQRERLLSENKRLKKLKPEWRPTKSDLRKMEAKLKK